MRAESLDLFAILECLARHGIDFIIVGGVSAVLNGAPRPSTLRVTSSSMQTHEDSLVS